MPIFGHFYCFGAFSYCAVGAFLAIFEIFLGFVGICWVTPAIYCADFGAILAILTTFGPFLDHFLGRFCLAFFMPKNSFLARYTARARVGEMRIAPLWRGSTRIARSLYLSLARTAQLIQKMLKSRLQEWICAKLPFYMSRAGSQYWYGVNSGKSWKCNLEHPEQPLGGLRYKGRIPESRNSISPGGGQRYSAAGAKKFLDFFFRRRRFFFFVHFLKEMAFFGKLL